MPSRWNFFWDAFRLTVSKPKLFLPKLALSVLYGFLMLETAKVSIQMAPFVLEKTMNWTPQEASQLLAQTLLLLFLTLLVMVIDVWIGSWYPVLVSQYRERKTVSFRSAIRESWKRFSVVLPLVFGFELLIAIILSLFLNAALFSLPLEGFAFSVLVGLLVSFLVTVALYPLLSVGVLEKKSVVGSVKRTFDLSKKNWKIFSLASVLQFAISLANFVLAFLAQKPEFLLLFWIARIALALAATYNAAVNPSAYFEATEKE